MFVKKKLENDNGKFIIVIYESAVLRQDRPYCRYAAVEFCEPISDTKKQVGDCLPAFFAKGR